MIEQATDITREHVLERLREVEKEHDVRILYACECGSRAHGLNHVKSDYDVRFLYVRAETAFVTVKTYRSKRDVITPKVGGEGGSDWDISGWDLRKALLLLRDCNPTLMEWLFSPVVYLEVGDTVETMRKVARQYFNPGVCMHHYFNWVKNTYKKLLIDKEEGEGGIPLKKLLCVLRLLFYLIWLERPNAGVVQFDFAALSSTVLEDVDTYILENVNMLADMRRKCGLDAVPQWEDVDNIFRYISEEFIRFDERKFDMKKVDKAPYEIMDDILRNTLRAE